MDTVFAFIKKYSKLKSENEYVAMNKMGIMNIKTLTHKISCLTYFIILSTTLIINTQIHSMVCEFDDEFDNLINNITPEELEILRSCESGEAATWNSFLTDANIPQALNNDFYLQTELPRTRNLINYPEWQLCTYQNMDSINQFNFHLFYNQTSRKNYTKSVEDIDGTKIGSYINVDKGTFLSLLEAALHAPNIPPAALLPLKNLNFPLVFYNLANARLEERRLGFMAHYYHQMSNKTYFEAKMPFFWMIKNLQLTNKEKQTLQDQFAAYLGNGFDNFDELEFAKKHIIFDALGTGTMELSLCTTFLERSNWHIDGGAFVFLPTDCQMAKGLYGTYIEPQDQQPILDLCSLIDNISTSPSISPNFNTIISNYFYAALDQLSSALLQCPLGYYRTFACGLKLSPYWKPHENLEFHGLYTIELLLPYSQKRFFVLKNKGDFSDEYNKLPNGTDTEADAKLLFLEARLTELLFPRVFETKLFPGFIINSTSSMHKSYKDWNFVLGYNGWFQSDENFISIELPKDLNINDWNIEKSMAQDAYMIKIFGKIHHDIHLARHDMSLTLWADAAVFSNTVGNDFTLGVSFDTKF